MTLNRHPVIEDDLCRAYSRLAEALPRSHPELGSLGFYDSMRLLSGSFLTRSLDPDTRAVSYDLFTPAIGDYVLHRFRSDSELLARCFRALRTLKALDALESMSAPSTVLHGAQRQEVPAILGSSAGSQILSLLGRDLVAQLEQPEDQFSLLLAKLLLDDDTATSQCRIELSAFLDRVLGNAIQIESEHLSTLFLRGIQKGLLLPADSRLTQFYLADLSFTLPEAIPPFWKLYEVLHPDTQKELSGAAVKAAMKCWENNVNQWVWAENLLEEYLDDEEESWAAATLTSALSEIFDRYPVKIPGAAEAIAKCVDLDHVLQNNIEAEQNRRSEDSDDSGRWRSQSNSNAISAVDELFDRG